MLKPKEILMEYPTAAGRCTATGRLVLHKITHNTYTPYAVHWENLDTGGCTDGGYYTSLELATEDFNLRVTKEKQQTKGD